jgi:hypothetical protein
MAGKMTGEDLRSCPEGTKLTYVVGEGSAEKRYPALRRHSEAGWVMITVRYAEDDRRSFRWSTITNQPSHESRGYVGTVRLERRS